jgi:hypothetical protein
MYRHNPDVYSYEDYRKIRSGQLDVLDREHIAKFLVFDYFYDSAYEAQTVQDVKNIALDSWAGQTRKSQSGIRFFFVLDAILGKMFALKAPKPPRKKILFQNAKFPDLILRTRKYHDVGLIVEGKKDRIFSWRHLLGYVAADDLHYLVYRYLRENNVQHFYKLIEEIEKKLKKARPDYIILRDDYGPLPRSIILAARKLKIPTMVIQHGIYDLSFRLCNDVAADYALFWGKYFRDLYVDQKAREAETIFILGYPYKFPPIPTRSVVAKPVICYLGQDYERYQPELLSIKLKNMKELSDVCRDLGWNFMYRPHPGDDRSMLKSRLPDVIFTPPGEPLMKTIGRSDILISFSSTTLVEAAMHSKVSLQLFNYPIKSDNFEKLGVVAKTCETVLELVAYMKSIVDSGSLVPPPFNNDYIEIGHDLGDRVSYIISQIESRRSGI